MELKKLYSTIHQKLNQLDFTKLYNGFKKYDFILYTSKEYCFCNEIYVHDAEFYGNTAIEWNGKIIAIEEMSELKTKRLKFVTIETDYSIPQVTLSGVSNLKTEGKLIKFNYNGDMKKLVKYLNSIDVNNVEITDAGLEEMFLHFYE